MINSEAIKLIAAAAIVFCPTLINGAAYVISDDRVRSLDITPVLGRGYSIGSNSFQSTCLMVSETTTPSYNYDYTFNDFSGTYDLAADLAATLSDTFGYEGIKKEAKLDAGNSESSVRMVISTMRIERYYSSVREEISPLSPAALKLLENQDYIGFFKSCGPGYTRSIRRAQEITSIFKFVATSTQSAAAFASGLKKSGSVVTTDAEPEDSLAAQPQFATIASSLEIKILGFGLGLNIAGSSTLVSTNLAEFNEVMKFAFTAFTTAENAAHIGMVYGIEVVPWVDNTEFQVASKVLEENVEIPLGRSLIPRAVVREAATTSDFRNTLADRALYKCKGSINFMDKYGYCCEENMLFNPAAYEYETEPGITDNQEAYISLRVCKPVRVLDKSLVKNNMSNNGEFVARLDSILRTRMNTIFTLEKCISRLNSFTPRFDYNILKPKDSVNYDARLDLDYSVKMLKLALDPLKNYGMIQHLGQEMDEYIEMYYNPCIAALFGANIGVSADVEPQFFMAYGWMQHSACLHLSCLADNMRWDRGRGGCVVSVFAGSNSDDYDTTNDSYCVKDDEVITDNDVEVCKTPTPELTLFQTKAKDCWGGEISPSSLMDKFCMPQVTGDIVSVTQQDDLVTQITRCDAAISEFDDARSN